MRRATGSSSDRREVEILEAQPDGSPTAALPQSVHAAPRSSLQTPAALVDAARQYARDARADSTWRAYEGHWRRFLLWCEQHGRSALPASPETVVLYVTHLAEGGRVPATISQCLAAISQCHIRAREPSPREAPEVREVWRGIRRRKGIAPTQKLPFTTENVRAALRLQPRTLAGARDAAVLLIGFSSAMRRSEIATLTASNVTFVNDGLEIKILRSKTDQEGIGRTVVVAKGADPATCPVQALRTWLQAACITEGPVFRPISRHGKVGAKPLTGHGIGDIVKRIATALGLDATAYGAHSLRAGFVTAATDGRASDREIMDQTGHKSVATMMSYQRRSKAWDKPASGKLGL